MRTRPEHLSSDRAAELAGELLIDAVKALKAVGVPDLSNRALGEAVGYSEDSADKHWRDHCNGDRPLTLPKLLQLCANRPTVGHAVLTRLVGWFVERQAGAGPRCRIAALDAVLRELMELLREGYDIRADNVVDDGEAPRLRGRITRLRRLLDQLEATLGPAAEAPRAVGEEVPRG